MRSVYQTVWIVAIGICFTLSVPAGDFERFDNCRLAKRWCNDGDSFMVTSGQRELHVRLYFVDCPETHGGKDVNMRRIYAQMRYFGQSNVVQVVRHGRQATTFTRDCLSEPFTVHTAFAQAPGAVGSNRIYAMVTCADGEDLGLKLVRNGWARAYGVGRAGPDGMTRDERKARLADEEIAAAMRRKGIWATTDAERIAVMRAEQRAEEKALSCMELGLDEDVEYPLDVNQAAAAALRTIPGVGEVMAQRIIAGRPYRTLTELERVKGIGPTTVGRLAEYLEASRL